ERWSAGDRYRLRRAAASGGGADEVDAGRERRRLEGEGVGTRRQRPVMDDGHAAAEGVEGLDANRAGLGEGEGEAARAADRVWCGRQREVRGGRLAPGARLVRRRLARQRDEVLLREPLLDEPPLVLRERP